MAGSDIAAALMGALDGGLRGYGQVQQRKRQQQEDEEELRRRAFDEALRVRQAAATEASAARQAERDAGADDRALRTDYGTVLAETPARTPLSQIGVDPQELQRLGLAHRYDAPMAEVKDDTLGSEQIGFAVIPSINADATVRESSEQRKAREAANAARNEQAVTKQRLSTFMGQARNPLLKDAIGLGEVTGKMPTFSARDMEDPAAAEARDFGQFVKRQNYQHEQTLAEMRAREGLMRSRPDTSAGSLGPDGVPVRPGRPVTSGDANTMADLGTALTDLDALETALTETSTATGTGAYLGSMTPNAITELTGIGGKAKSRQAVIDRVKQVIGKALEGGVLRKEDEIKYTKILPTISDTPEVASSKLRGLKQAIERRRGQQIESLSDAGYDVSGFVRRQGGAPAQAPAAASRAPTGARKRIKGGGIAEYRDGQWVRVE